MPGSARNERCSDPPGGLSTFPTKDSRQAWCISRFLVSLRSPEAPIKRKGQNPPSMFLEGEMDSTLPLGRLLRVPSLPLKALCTVDSEALRYLGG